MGPMAAESQVSLARDKWSSRAAAIAGTGTAPTMGYTGQLGFHLSPKRWKEHLEPDLESVGEHIRCKRASHSNQRSTFLGRIVHKNWTQHYQQQFLYHKLHTL